MNEDIWRIIMKRLLVVVISIIAGLTRLSAQEAGTGVIEIGAGCSLYGMLGAIGGPYRFLSPGVFTEYRYGIAERFDLGAQLNYRFGNGESEYFGLHIKRFRVAIETDLAYDTEHWNSVATATALNVGFSF